jgi:molybdopterin-guanine dinucleotide biosynthesis protein A
MPAKHIAIVVDKDTYDKMRPFLKEEERSFSAWMRLAMVRYVHEQESIRDGKTQVDMKALRRNII